MAQVWEINGGSLAHLMAVPRLRLRVVVVLWVMCRLLVVSRILVRLLLLLLRMPVGGLWLPVT